MIAMSESVQEVVLPGQTDRKHTPIPWKCWPFPLLSFHLQHETNTAKTKLPLVNQIPVNILLSANHFLTFQISNIQVNYSTINNFTVSIKQKSYLDNSFKKKERKNRKTMQNIFPLVTRENVQKNTYKLNTEQSTHIAYIPNLLNIPSCFCNQPAQIFSYIQLSQLLWQTI